MNTQNQSNQLLPPGKIYNVASELGLDPDIILPHGHYIAKVPIDQLESRADEPDGHLVLV